MAEDVPQETEASQEVLREAARTARKVGEGLLGMAKALLAGRGREPGSGSGLSEPEKAVGMRIPVGGTGARAHVRDPFEHLEIARRQAERDLLRYYREARARADRGDPMDLADFQRGEAVIARRMGPDRDAVATRMRADVFSKGPVRSARAPVRRAHEGPLRQARGGPGSASAVRALSRGPREAVTVQAAAMALGLGAPGRGR